MKPSKIERIAARAYEIWEQEGRPPDKAAEHWRRAEQAVAAEDKAEQMGAPPPEVDTRPVPPLEAAPPLAGEDRPAEDPAQKPAKRKSAPRRKRGEPQQG